jgi:hypothetical protein
MRKIVWWIVDVLVFIVAVVGINFAARELFDPHTRASAESCCTYGVDCARGYVCCTPRTGQADCSSGSANYCHQGTQCAPPAP